MTENELSAIEARLEAFDSSRSMDDVTIIESVTEFITSAPSDLRALLLEVRRLQADLSKSDMKLFMHENRRTDTGEGCNDY